jgi:outer membrane biosynthesis protein TonB
MPPAVKQPVVRATCPPRTFSIVAAIHAGIFVLLFLVSFLLSFRNPPQKVIEMVNLGTDNPGKGEYDGEPTQGGGGTQEQLPPAPESPPKPPTPIKPVQQKVQEAVPEPPKPVPPPPKPPVQTPVQQAPVKPQPVAPPVKPKPPATVKATESKAPDTKKFSLKEVTRPSNATGGGTSTSAQAAKQAGKGPGASAGDIKNGLKESVKAAGVSDGTGHGAYGDPNGSPDANKYLSLLKYELTRAWRRPTLGDSNLSAYVRVQILRDGTLVFKGIDTGSGDTVFDGSVADAVRACGKLSKPLPDGMGDPNYEVSVQFKLQD